MENYEPARGTALLVVAVLHLICCGLPFLLLSGVSLGFLTPYWPVAAGGLALLGVVGFARHLKHGLTSCSRNENCPKLPTQGSTP